MLAFRLADHGVELTNKAIVVADLSVDAALFHRVYRRAFVDLCEHFDALPLVGAIVQANVQTLFRKLFVAEPCPTLAQFFQRAALVEAVAAAAFGFVSPAFFIPDAITVFIQDENLFLLFAEKSVRLDGPHGNQNVHMWVGGAAWLALRIVHRVIADQSFRDEILLQESQCQLHVFFKREFVLERKLVAVSQLRVAPSLVFLHGIP